MSPLDRRAVLALAAALALVALAVPLGLGAARLAARPSPLPVATFAPVVFPSAAPEDPAAVFRQPLAAGCATGQAVWVVAEGGGIGRYDGSQWSLVDPTLRSLGAAACGRDVMVAVGGGGRVLFADDARRSIRPETVYIDDLNGVSRLGDGVLVVGSRGTVLLQDGVDWQPYAQGITEDLYGVAAFSRTSAWAVGAGGVTYRLEEAGWRPVASGVTATLRAVAASGVDDAVAVGDAGTLLRWDGGWKPLRSGTSVDLRAAARAPSGVWVAGDRGTLLRVAGSQVTALDLGTTCDLRGVFARGTEVWVVGSDARRAAVWRIDGEDAMHWGTC